MSELEQIAIVWTIRFAVGMMVWAYFQWLWASAPSPVDPRLPHSKPETIKDDEALPDNESSKTKYSRALLIWFIGSLFSLIHTILAMTFAHKGSLAAAEAETARQTSELLGVAVGWGVYFNFVFVVAWLVDAIWGFVWPASYRQRSRWISLSVHGYLVFIAINGAIVFATGPVRYFGIGAIGLLLSTYFAQRKTKLQELVKAAELVDQDF